MGGDKQAVQAATMRAEIDLCGGVGGDKPRRYVRMWR